MDWQDMNASLERLKRMGELQDRHMALMVSTSGGATEEEVRGLMALMGDYLELRKEVPEEDRFVTVRNVDERLADTANWLARALEATGEYEQALEMYEQAASMYRAVEKAADVERMEEQIAAVRLHISQDFDAELKRLVAKLEATAPRTPERVDALLALAEFRNRLGDHGGAVEWLNQVVENLDPSPPTADDLTKALLETLTALQDGTLVPPTPLERALAHRFRYRRLYLALSQAYRRTQPELSEEYAGKAREFDDQQMSHGLQDQLLAMLPKGGG